MTKVTDDTIRAWVDGELSAEHAAELELLIRHDVELQQKAARFEASKLPYKAAMKHDVPPVPEALREQVAQWSQISSGAPLTTDKPRFQGRYWLAGSAAAVVFSLLLWGGLFLTRSQPMDVWTESIVSYQNFYVAETVAHIVGDRKAGENKLLKLSQANQAFPKSLPNLTAQGYHYKRMQQLDFDGKPVLQMVFYKPGKRPLAVCLMPDDTQFDAQFSQHRLLNSYVWQSGETRVIVVAEESLGVMEKIAKMVNI